jgi:hypothetical protein
LIIHWVLPEENYAGKVVSRTAETEPESVKILFIWLF